MRTIETPLEPQTFHDGLAVFYQTKNTAPKGNRPAYEAIELLRCPFTEKKIGDVRYYAAMQADSKISKVIRIPRVTGLQPSGDICKISGCDDQFIVQKIARNTMTTPESLDVTLSNVNHKYVLNEEATETDET